MTCRRCEFERYFRVYRTSRRRVHDSCTALKATFVAWKKRPIRSELFQSFRRHRPLVSRQTGRARPPVRDSVEERSGEIYKPRVVCGNACARVNNLHRTIVQTKRWQRGNCFISSHRVVVNHYIALLSQRRGNSARRQMHTNNFVNIFGVDNAGSKCARVSRDFRNPV